MSKEVQIPFSEPSWLMGLPSAYYNDSHRKWQKTCRALVDELLMPNAHEWEMQGDVPPNLFSKFAAANFLIPNLPAPLPVAWLHKLGIPTLPGGLAVEDFDYMHTLIYADEMARTGSTGPPGAVTTGMAFGVPPILKFGSQELQERFVPDLLTGRKRTCIAITEPGAGSDVGNIQTTAERTEDGKSFLVNGMKKWFDHQRYLGRLCLDGRPNRRTRPSGLSMLVVPLLNTPGVTMRRLKVGGQTSAGTTLITLDDVLVPVANLIGTEGAGMRYIMQNFNHERLTICISVNRLARVALSSALEYCMRREAFGKALVEQPVVRHRLAKCGAQLEAQWAWIEQFTYSMTVLSEADANRELGGLTALAKAQAGSVLEVCASTAVLLFGGNGYTKGGQGAVAE
ncbi:Acyl-CoA dehydrogenase, partial [Lachnellula willkommii]